MDDWIKSNRHLLTILIASIFAGFLLLARSDALFASGTPEAAQSESLFVDAIGWAPAESLEVNSVWRDTLGARLVGRWGGLGPSRTVAASEKGKVLYFNIGRSLEVVDFSDPSRPVRKGASGFSLPPADLDVAGGYAYAALNHGSIAGATQGEYGLGIAQLPGDSGAEPNGTYVTDGYASAVDVADGYVYLADGKGGLQILDASVPSAGVRMVVSTFSLGAGVVDVIVSEEHAYVACGADGLQVLDVADPKNPERIGAFEPEGKVVGVAVEGNYAYVTVRTHRDAEVADELRIIDVASPSTPREVGYFEDGGVWDVAEGYAYLPIGGQGGNGLQILDVSDPSSPQRAGQFNPQTYGQHLAVSEGVILDGYAYLASRRYPAGLYVVELG